MTFDEIASAAGCSRATLYRYFENRDVLLTAMIVEAYDALGDAAEGRKVVAALIVG